MLVGYLVTAHRDNPAERGMTLFFYDKIVEIASVLQTILPVDIPAFPIMILQIIIRLISNKRTMLQIIQRLSHRNTSLRLEEDIYARHGFQHRALVTL